jgi:hypothetical protein
MTLRIIAQLYWTFANKIIGLAALFVRLRVPRAEETLGPWCDNGPGLSGRVPANEGVRLERIGGNDAAAAAASWTINGSRKGS